MVKKKLNTISSSLENIIKKQNVRTKNVKFRLNSFAYFCGGKDPENYIPEERLIQRSRLDQFFQSYDLYDVNDDKRPGTNIYNNLDKYDSVSDFLNDSRIKNKKKETEELYMLPSGKIKKKKISRAHLLSLAFDFPLENQITPMPFGQSDFFGGMGDIYFQTHDFEGKSPDNLDYSRLEGFDEFVESLDDNKFVGILSHLINDYNSFLGYPGDDLDNPDIKSNNYYDKITENVPGHSIGFE